MRFSPGTKKEMKLLKICWLILLAAAASAGADQIHRLPLPANDLVYDRVRQRVYASLSRSAGRLGNSVVPIDPLLEPVGPPLYVGSEPGKLALSDDGQYLYVSL